MAALVHPRAALGTTKRSLPGVLSRARAIYLGFTANAALFPSPTVAMVAFLALLEALEAAQVDVATARAFASTRDAKRDALWTAMGSLVAFVQALADTMTPNQAMALIEQAGMVVAKVVIPHKAVLEATLVPQVGRVILKANRTTLAGRTRKQVTFHWQVSADGQAWSDLPSTPYAETIVSGLTLMTRYYFRVRVTVGDVDGRWTDAESLVVV